MLIPLVNAPTGIFPRTQAHLLPANAAQAAVDCDFSHGTLAGVRPNGSTIMSTSQAIKSAYVQGTSWFSWNRDVDAVRGPVADDAYVRFYWTDGTTMRVSRADVGGSGGEPSGYRVGVPAPAAAMYAMDQYNFVLPFQNRSTLFASVQGYCEDTVTLERTGYGMAVYPTVAQESRDQMTFEMELSGLACEATASTQTPGAGAATLVGTASASFNEISGDSGAAITGVADVFDRGSERLFRSSYSPVANLVSSGAFAYDGVAYSYSMYGGTTLYLIGGTNWFSTLANATVPTATELAATATAVPQYLVDWKFTTLSGTNISVLIRPTGVTLPAELSGIDAAVSLNGTRMTVTLTRDQLAVESRAYTCTYVNQYGEESAPAAPLVIDALDGQYLDFVYPMPPTTGNWCPITSVRIYRTATGSQSTEYLFVAEVPVSTGTFRDEVKTANLGEPISTIGFLPPEEGLKGLRNIGNGMLAAFKGNEVHISQAYLPYAWKSANIQTLPTTVVGIVPFENSLYVTTTAHPAIITGVDPDSMQNQGIPAIQAGVSKGSICNVGPFVAYASHDGIVTARGLDATLDYSNKFFTRDDWRQRYGNKMNVMRMDAHDGNLLVWFTDGTLPFLLRFEEEAPSMTDLVDPIYAAYVHPQADALYVGVANSLYEYKGGSIRKPFTWHSKDFIAPTPTNFGVMQLVGSGTVAVQVYADGSLIHTQSVTLASHDRTVIRLPAGFLARRWSVKFVGSTGCELKEAYLANVPSELQGV